MSKVSKKWKNFHHQIYNIYHSIIALVLIPFALLFLEWNSDADSADTGGTSSKILMIQAGAVFVIGSFGVWKSHRLAYDISKEMTLQEKMKEFRSKNVWKYSLLALMGLVFSLVMWLDPAFFYVIPYLGVLVQFSLLRPSEDKFIRDMQVTKEERRLMHGLE